jgi:hypothetical protein
MSSASGYGRRLGVEDAPDETGPPTLLGVPLPSPEEARATRKWWREVLLIAVFYLLYSIVRDARGNKPVGEVQARHHALALLHLEQALHVFYEGHIQHFFMHWRFVVELCDDYYGSAHFLVVVGTLIFLFFRRPERYPHARNTLAITTGLALVGFYFYPVMPPRLLPASYGIIDTLQKVGGLWNFSSGPVNAVSNQYAAMPSLHTAWAAWCALALVPVLRHRWAKIAMASYPLLTVIVIIITGNHYFLDALAGLLTVGSAYFLAFYGTWLGARHRRTPPSPARRAPAGPTSRKLD